MKYKIKENILPIILAVLISILTLVILFGVVLNEPKITNASYYFQQSKDEPEVELQQEDLLPAVDETVIYSDWVENLPYDVKNNREKYDIEEKTQYRTRTLVASETQSKYRTRFVSIKTGDWKKGIFDAQSYRDREIDVVRHIPEILDGVGGFRVEYKDYSEWSEWKNGLYKYNEQEADEIQIQTDYIYEYSGWSEWSDNRPAETPEGTIKERTMYKYCTKETNLDDGGE